MTKPVKAPKKTRAQLEASIAALEAQLISTVTFAAGEISELAKKDFAASAMIVSIKALNGRDLIRPVAISNGLSPETLAALHADVIRTRDYITEIQPAAFKGKA